MDFLQTKQEAVRSSMRGKLFETYCIRKLRAVATSHIQLPVDMKRLGSPSAHHQFVVDLRSAHDFSLLSTLSPSDSNQLWVPSSENCAVVDFLISPSDLLNTTDSLHHPVLMHRLLLLLQQLDNAVVSDANTNFRLIFMVPPDKYDDFSVQNYLTTKKTKAVLINPRIAQHVVQYVVKMPIVRS